MQAKGRTGWDKALRIVVSITISGLAAWLVLRTIDFKTLVNAFKSITIGQIIWCCAFFLIGLMLRVWSWHIILNRKFPVRRVFNVMNAGYLLNNVLPFKLGEIGRAILLGSSEAGKPSRLEVLSGVVMERIYDVFLAAVFFLSCLPWVVVDRRAKLLAWLMLGIMVAIFAAIVWATLKRSNVSSWMEGHAKKGNKILTWVKPKMEALLQGFAVVADWRMFAASFGLMVLSWVMSMVQQTTLRLTLMPEGEWWWVIFVLAAGAFGGALPSAPASLGVYEAANVAAFALLGVDQSVALAYALIVHAIVFVFTSMFGVIGLIKEGQSISSLYQKARRQKGSASEISS